MEPNRPNNENENSDVADLAKRMCRGATPAPEDHSTEEIDSLEGRSDGVTLRDMGGMPRDGRHSDMTGRMNRWGTRDDEEGPIESTEPVGNRPGSDAFGLGGGLTRNMIMHARNTPGDSNAASYEDNVTADWTRQSLSRPNAPTSTPARSSFGGPLASLFARPEGLASRSSRRTSREEVVQARDSQVGWFNLFSPLARRSTEGLSDSSQQAVQYPDAIFQSIGTQRLMPSRDPMAPFHAEPRPKGRNITPSAYASPEIRRNEEELRRARVGQWHHG
jgi:hypothetical protein